MPAGRLTRTQALVVAAVAVCAVVRPAAGAPSRSSWTIGPPAPWVRPIPLPVSPPGTTSTTPAPETPPVGGKVYRLVDRQVRVAETVVEYNRLAWTAISTEGVQNASELQIDFDPSYQRLVIHHVRLLRDGRDVFAFRRSEVRIIQAESALDEQIYSGQLTAVIFLHDLRPGDTLDYAYSLEGTNAILSGGYDDELWLQYGSPVERLRQVLTVPEAMTLHVTPRNTSLKPVVESSGGWRTYTWEASHVPAQVADEDEPGWFDPDPRVVVSTFGSWAEVARWAEALFDAQSAVSPEIRQLAARWHALPGGPLAAAAEATRFVQDEVRYLGVEMGPGSYVPRRPGEVLRQRFGDCKDKALLLVALLRELGIDAAPALVDTERGRGLDDEPASAFAFDHAIVRAAIDGRIIWIDATESARGGRIEDWDPPPYERALVLAPGTDRLTRIEPREHPEPSVAVKETYTLAGNGRGARLDVVTTYRREEADDMRRTLATTAPQDLAKDYLDYFGKQFAEISAVGRPTASDDRARNIVTVSESYEIATFWKNEQRELTGWQVQAHMPRSIASTRTTPLAVPHPVHVQHEIAIRAPRRFRVASRRERIAADAFLFTSDLSATDRDLRLVFDYRSRADAVMPATIKAHQQAMERVKDALSFVLTRDLEEKGAERHDIPWLLLAALLGLAAGGAIAALVLSRRHRRISESRL